MLLHRGQQASPAQRAGGLTHVHPPVHALEVEAMAAVAELPHLVRRLQFSQANDAGRVLMHLPLHRQAPKLHHPQPLLYRQRGRGGVLGRLM